MSLPETTLHLSRQDWVTSCQFASFPDSDVLSKVVAEVESVKKMGKEKPLIIFDLDSTLYEVAPRTHGILVEWVEARREHLPSEISHALGAIDVTQVGYSPQDIFSVVGLSPELPHIARACEDFREFWRPRFFSNEYLPLDRPYAGAPEFARYLHDQGAVIFYLTGRERKKMVQGTLDNLRRDGFPLRAVEFLLMKDQTTLSDLDHKVQFTKSLLEQGRLIASFENEPRNLAGMHQLYPNAYHVFVETICSNEPAPRCEGIYRIRDFQSKFLLPKA